MDAVDSQLAMTRRNTHQHTAHSANTSQTTPTCLRGFALELEKSKMVQIGQAELVGDEFDNIGVEVPRVQFQLHETGDKTQQQARWDSRVDTA